MIYIVMVMLKRHLVMELYMLEMVNLGIILIILTNSFIMRLKLIVLL